jgi:hypothetical protein
VHIKIYFNLIQTGVQIHFQSNIITLRLKNIVDTLLFTSHIDLQHGIVFCKTPLDAFCPFIEFKITMNIPCRGKSHLFIGLVDKTKYKYENLGNLY